MKEFCSKEPYKGKDEIVNYLRNKGKPSMASTAVAKDRFTGERIKGEIGVVLYDDGEFNWYSDLAYHVEKYNLQLPKEFMEHVLKDSE